jgi:hypothetical protein
MKDTAVVQVSKADTYLMKLTGMKGKVVINGSKEKCGDIQ